MARMKRGAKTAAVREYITANPDAKPATIIAAMKGQGLTVKRGLVASVKFGDRSKVRKRRAGTGCVCRSSQNELEWFVVRSVARSQAFCRFAGRCRPGSRRPGYAGTTAIGNGHCRSDQNTTRESGVVFFLAAKHRKHERIWIAPGTERGVVRSVGVPHHQEAGRLEWLEDLIEGVAGGTEAAATGHQLNF